MWCPSKQGMPVCVVFVMMILAGCAVHPSETDIKEALARHFAAQRYRVIDVTLGDVRSQPIGERTYMGTAGYRIHVRRLTLERIDEREDISRKQTGDHLTFTDGTVSVREDPGQPGRWIISNITSNLAP